MDLYQKLVDSAQIGDLGEVLALLARKADPNDQATPSYWRHYDTPLTLASAGSSDDHAAVISALLEAKADVEGGDSCGRTPLYYASHFGNAANVEILLRAKADINRPTADGRTPLSYAVYWERAPVVKILLEAGADVEMDEAIVADSSAEIREMLRAAAEERRAKACWRSWARAMLHAPTEGDSPPTEELRAFFVAYPGLRRFVGTKLLRFSRAE